MHSKQGNNYNSEKSEAKEAKIILVDTRLAAIMLINIWVIINQN